MINLINLPVSVVVKDIAIGTGVLGSFPGPVKAHIVSATARYRRGVSSELCCPSAKPQR